MSRALVLLAILMVSAPAGAGEMQDTVFVRMLPGTLQQAQQAGLRPVHILDYGSFAWLELAATDLSWLQRRGLPYDPQPDPYRLQIGGQSFDPLRDGVPLPAGWPSTVATPGPGPDLHLVQLAGPTRAEWLAALADAGLESVRYVHPYTYIVWGDVAALAQVAAHDFVRWTGAFEPAYRLDPRWRALGEAPLRASVLLYRGADLDQVARGVERLGGDLGARVPLDPVLAQASLHLPAAALPAAARIPGVYSIQLEPSGGGLRGEMGNQVNVNNISPANAAFPGYREWLAGLGLDGTGVIIADVDNGIQNLHPDLIHRLRPCTGTSCDDDGIARDHGTHTAGIMAADGSSGTVDNRGFLRGQGMAPGAGLVEQLYDPVYTQEGGMRLLMAESYRNGASISGNSWGAAGNPQGYDGDTMQVDIGVRDADPALPGNQPLTYVLSIMNGYGETSTQGSPDEAKNILTVGSTCLQYADGIQRLNIDDLSLNTAHGPALDGRKIPHLVAPGYWVDSTASSSDYLLLAGTSMASPQVSGAAALFVQYYRAWRGTEPSPALIKAAFLAVAHDLAGHLDADGNVLGHPFDNKQGWGRLDAAAVLDPQVPVLYFDQRAVLDDTGQVWQHELRVADSSRPLRLMLAWTDAPGHGLGLASATTPAWNNDLDLAVEAAGETYVGNAFDAGGWSLAGGGVDGMNNTEGIFLPAGGASPFTVRVVASNISSDGIPNQGDSTDQDFALVCYNCLPLSGPPRLVYLPVVEN